MLRLKNIHPGDVLREDFLQELRIAPATLAQNMRVPLATVEDILACKAPVTVDIAMRLARSLGTSGRVWVGLQAQYDLEEAELAPNADIANIACLNPDRPPPPRWQEPTWRRIG